MILGTTEPDAVSALGRPTQHERSTVTTDQRATEDDDHLSSLIDKVRTWLAGTGYPLEFRVAEAARAHSPHWIDQSRYYADPVTRKMRETDVVVQWVGQRRQVYATTVLAIECKSKPRPWIVFDNNRIENDPVARLDWALYKATNRHDANGDPIVDPDPAVATFVDTEKSLFRMSRVGTGIVSAFPKKDESQNNGWDPAWEAVQAAVSAAHGVNDDMIVSSPGSFQLVRIAVFPVVVTSGRLFRAFLGSNGELDVEATDRAELLVRREHSEMLTRCLVVTELGLEALLAEAAVTPRALLHGDIPDMRIHP